MMHAPVTGVREAALPGDLGSLPAFRPWLDFISDVGASYDL